MHLVIGGPTRDTVPASCAVDLAELYAYTRARGPWREVTLGFVESTYVHVGRAYTVTQCQAMGATHLLWLDTDMRVPPYAAVQLARHEQPFVAANCLMRDPRRIWTARRFGHRVATTSASSGLEVVDEVGLAVCLMRLDLVSALPMPLFTHTVSAEGEDIGEDLTLCRALRAAGHPLYIDHDLSKEIGHVGLTTYRFTPTTEAAVTLQPRGLVGTAGCE